MNRYITKALGICAILAVQGWSAAQAITGFEIQKTAAQVLTAPYDPAEASYDIVATGGGGTAPVVFSVDPLNVNVCGIVGNLLYAYRAGTCKIFADQAASTGFTAAPQVSTTLTVTLYKNTLVATDIYAAAQTKPYKEVPSAGQFFVTLPAAGSNPNPVELTSTTPNVCTISGLLVTPQGAGACIIAADQAGDGVRYDASTQVTQTITISPITQALDPANIVGTPGTIEESFVVSIDLPGTPAVVRSTFGQATFNVKAGSESICEVINATLTKTSALVKPKIAGACIIQATLPAGDLNAAGNANYVAVGPIEKTFTINKAVPTLENFAGGPGVYTDGTTGVEVTVTTNSSGAVSYASTTTGVCDITNTDEVIAKTSGACTIEATVATDTKYSARTVAFTIQIAKADQTIGSLTVDPVSPVTYVTNGTFTVTGVKGASAVDLVYTVSPASVCEYVSIATGTVATIKMLLPGLCEVTVTEAGDTKYNAAPSKKIVVTIQKAAQTVSSITGGPTVYKATPVVGTDKIVAAATSTLTVTYGTNTPEVCTVDPSTGLVTTLKGGDCEVTADQAGNATYLAAPQSKRTITISKANQSITADGDGNYVRTTATTFVYGTGFVVTAVTSSGLPAIFSASGSCTVANGLVAPTTSGNCIITASVSSTDQYNTASSRNRTFYITKAAQTLSDISPATGGTITIDDPTTITTSASSTLTPELTSKTPLVCSFDGDGKLVAHIGGTCTIEANQAGDDKYATATAKAASYTVTKLTQTITDLEKKSGVQKYGSTFVVGATKGASVNAVTYTTSTSDICAVVAHTGLVTPKKKGTCTILADQASSDVYAAAEQVSEDFEIAGSDQIISAITGTTPILYGVTTSVSTTSNSGLAIEFTTSSTDVCDIATASGITTVTPKKSGVCTVVANQAGNDYYEAAPQVTKEITINKAAQVIGTISIDNAPLTYNSSDEYTLSATSTSAEPIVYTLAGGEDNCEMDGDTKIIVLKPGTCTVLANQAADAGDKYSAATQVSQDFPIAKLAQTITVGGGPSVYNAKANATASSNSGLTAFTFSSGSPSICTVSGAEVTAKALGTCLIVAAQAGNDYYEAGTGSYSLTIDKAPQVIGAISSSKATILNKETFTVSVASQGASTSPVVFATSGPCSISGSVVTATGGGDCIVTATQTADLNYDAATPEIETFTILPAADEITIGNGPSKKDEMKELTATSTSGRTNFAFTSLTPDVCSFANTDELTALALGKCEVQVKIVADADFEEGVVTKEFQILSGVQTLTVDWAASMPAKYNEEGTITASSDITGLSTFSFVTETPSVCSITPLTATTAKVKALKVGADCTVKAIQAGNVNYASATSTYTKQFAKATQTVAKPTVVAGTLKYLDSISVSAVASSGLTDLTFETIDPTVCIYRNGYVIAKLASETGCVLKAKHLGNASWEPAVLSDGLTIKIDKRPQTIGAISLSEGDISVIDGTGKLTATATSQQAVTFTSSTAATCEVSGSVDIEATAMGTCTVKATLAESANWLAAPDVTKSFVIGKKNQTITAITNGPTVYGQETNVSGTASSTLPVTFASNTPTICTVNGSAVKAIQVGKCIVRGNQVGDAVFNVAPVYTKEFVIAPKPLRIQPIAKTKAFGDPDTLNYATPSGLITGDKLVGKLGRVAGEDIGTYEISQGTMTDLANPKYDITVDAGVELEIVKRPVLVTADAKAKVYGKTDPALTFKSSGLALGMTVNGTLSRANNQNVGVYTIAIGDLVAQNPNYTITFVSNTMTISPMPVVVTAVAKSKVYGTTDPASSWIVTPSITGLTAITGALTRKTGDSVGVYAIQQGTVTSANNPNYTITFVTKNFSVMPKPIYVVADAKSIEFGATVTLTQKVYSDAAKTDLMAELLLVGSTRDVFSGQMARKAGVNAGVYPITVGTLANRNYTINFTGADYTITRKNIEVWAKSVSKEYGTANPVFQIETNPALAPKQILAGLVEPAASSLIGEYTILQGTVDNDKNPNYNITWKADKAGANRFTITEKTIFVKVNPVTKTYDGVLTDPAKLTYTVIGLVGTDKLSGSLAITGNAADKGEYTITKGTLANSNYDLPDVNFTGAKLTINPKILTITPKAVTYVYGEANAYDDTRLTFVPTGLVKADSTAGWIASNAGKLTREPGNDVGVYPIKIGTVTAPNYKITLAPAKVTISKRKLTITAVAKSAVYGDAPTALTYTAVIDANQAEPKEKGANGLVIETGVSGEAEDVLTGSLLGPTATTVGKYPINKGTINHSNYLITFVPEYYTITKKEIDLVVANATKMYGTANPAFSLTSTGLKAGDKLIGAPICKAALNTPTTGGDAALYEIDTAAGVVKSNPNYSINSSTKGNLTITRRPVKVNPNSLSKAANITADPTLTYVATGLYGADKLTGALERDAGTAVGTYPITQGGITNTANPNYDITFVTGKLFTILPALAKYVAKSKPVNELYSIEGNTAIYNIRGQLVWNGFVNAGGFLQATMSLENGNYMVKNSTIGNFTWEKR